MDPGGPGDSGVSIVEEGYPFTESVNQRFDVVGLDPRGVHTSEQVRCDAALDDAAVDAWNPTDQAEFDHLVAVNRRLAADCRETHRPARRPCGQPAVRARPGRRPRRARRGEAQLRRLLPRHDDGSGVRRVVPAPDPRDGQRRQPRPQHPVGVEWSRKTTAVLEDNFVAFADWCDTTDTCALYGQDTKNVYADLKERARRHARRAVDRPAAGLLPPDAHHLPDLPATDNALRARPIHRFPNVRSRTRRTG